MKMNETFDQCVLKERKACISEGRLSLMLKFFCGTHPKCSTDLKWSLNEAKKRVEEEYLIVGLLEDYESTLRLMEKLAPSLFKGIVTDYHSAERKKRSGRFHSNFKKPPSAEVRAILREKLDLTYQFYDFLKTKLELLKKEYDI
ncbi:uronyl 2-sulfotransferase-like isoform X2 [Amphiura filiformis]|uniref:uronyl 2-sulfotransferase-like isoform X2 n=1 Tax=Amphiura filiformis TaxID=82378 RepID=UPI003B227017